jgi:hypothetical protein
VACVEDYLDAPCPKAAGFLGCVFLPVATFIYENRNKIDKFTAGVRIKFGSPTPGGLLAAALDL